MAVACAVVPDAIEPVVAWRVWLLSERARPWRLESVLLPCSWPVGRELHARCLTSVRHAADGHASPVRACRCGVYGAGTAEALAGYVDYPYGPDATPRVVGLVALWGHVVEHELGWRASHAYPHHLWLPVVGPDGEPVAGWQQIAADLADYGVPLEVVERTDAESLLHASAEAWQRRRGRYPSAPAG